MTVLHEAVVDYLALRRRLGFKLHDAGLQLPRFVDFLEQRGSSTITSRLALEWAQQPTSVQPAEWARRLGYVRAFARHCSATDPHTEVPSRGLLPHRSTRAKPYLYSDAELHALLEAALAWPTRRSSDFLRPRLLHTFIGLLAATGLRTSEALGLHLEDVDLNDGLLTIRRSKLGRMRMVPIHRSTCNAIEKYLQLRQRSVGSESSPYLFVSSRGNQLDMAHLHRNFYALSHQVGLRSPGARHGPRLHDLRHRFAVQALVRWYEQGEDVQRRMPELSTYLGHVCVANTYWYLEAWPELMLHATARLERRWEGRA